MPRAIWSGAIGFGLVNVPVKLYTAVSRKDVRFNQLEAASGARIQLRKVSAATGEEVPADGIVRGFEVSKGRYVVIDDGDLEALAPAASKTIAIDQFASLEELDPILYDAAYRAAPEKGGARAYGLLHAALRDSGRIGVGRLMLRSRESLACIRAAEEHIVVHTLAWADEVIPPDTIPEIADLGAVEPTERERQMADLLIESMLGPLDLAAYRDTYRDAVLDLIERKAAGETVEAPTPAGGTGAPVADIMAALEASLAAAKARRTDAPAGDGDGEAPAKKTRSRSAAKGS